MTLLEAIDVLIVHLGDDTPSANRLALGYARHVIPTPARSGEE